MVDRTLAIAHTMTADMVCTGCGHPKHEAWNDDSAGWYEVKTHTCNGCVAADKDSKKNEDYDLSRKVSVVNERPADVKLKPWNPGT